jgi:hypothetical protein
MTTQMGIRIMVHPILKKGSNTIDRQLRYGCLSVTMFNFRMYSTILSRQQHKAAQIFCTDFGFVRAFPMKKESEANEALSLLFHRDVVPYVMAMDESKAQIEGQLRRMQDFISSRLNPTHNPLTWVKEAFVS